MEALVQPGSRAAYLLAGNATVTIVGKHSRFTYRIRTAPKAANKFWVSVLSGAENADDSSYRFLGTIIADSSEFKPFFRHSPKSPLGLEAPSAQAFVWAFKNLEDPRMQVYHAGHCGRCGRLLTTPESIQTGLGPVCAGRGSSSGLMSPRVRAAASELSGRMADVAFKHHGEFA